MKGSIKPNPFPALLLDHGITINRVCSEMCTGIKGSSALLYMQSGNLLSRDQVQGLVDFPTSQSLYTLIYERDRQLLDGKMLPIVKGAGQIYIWGWEGHSLISLLNKNISTFTPRLRRSSKVLISCSRIQNDQPVSLSDSPSANSD